MNSSTQACKRCRSSTVRESLGLPTRLSYHAMRTIACGPVAVADVAGLPVYPPGGRCTSAIASAQTPGGGVTPLFRSGHHRIRFAIDALISQPFPSVRICVRSSEYVRGKTSGVNPFKIVPNVGNFLSSLGWVRVGGAAEGTRDADARCAN